MSLHLQTEADIKKYAQEMGVSVSPAQIKQVLALIAKGASDLEIIPAITGRHTMNSTWGTLVYGGSKNFSVDETKDKKFYIHGPNGATEGPFTTKAAAVTRAKALEEEHRNVYRNQAFINGQVRARQAIANKVVVENGFGLVGDLKRAVKDVEAKLLQAAQSVEDPKEKHALNKASNLLMEARQVLHAVDK